MGGDVKPRHWTWAAQAQTRVPLPNVQLSIVSDFDPMYDPITHKLYIPKPGWGGWTYRDERVLFLHELGHVFDYTEMNRAERDRFRAAIGTGKCSWWGTCTLWREGLRDGVMEPGERFAEMYAACAIGKTREQVEAAGLPSYGWLPELGTDAALCYLIRAFA